MYENLATCFGLKMTRYRHFKAFKLYIQNFKSKPEDGFLKLKHVAMFS
jgi:hypothetical protein